MKAEGLWHQVGLTERYKTQTKHDYRSNEEIKAEEERLRKVAEEKARKEEEERKRLAAEKARKEEEEKRRLAAEKAK